MRSVLLSFVHNTQNQPLDSILYLSLNVRNSHQQEPLACSWWWRSRWWWRWTSCANMKTRQMMIITIFHLVNLLLVMRNDTIISSRFIRPFVCLFIANTRRSERKDRLCAPENKFESNISKAINFIIFSLTLRSFSCSMEVWSFKSNFYLREEMKTTWPMWKRKKNQNLVKTKNCD